MLTLQRTNNAEIVSAATYDKPIEDLLTKEWLLTNSRGGYASSTIVGCNTRRYHGLLVGSLRPPVSRIMSLANCLEMVIFNGKFFNLSTFEFDDKFAPIGFTHLVRFRRDAAVHFDYRLDDNGEPAASLLPRRKNSYLGLLQRHCKRSPLLEVTKSVYLLRNTDTVGLVYDFTSVAAELEFVLRPFVGLRDFHALQKSSARLCSRWLGDSLMICHDTPDDLGFAAACEAASPRSCRMFLGCPAAGFEQDEQWWFNFVYRIDRERGQDFTEDLWTPGFFKCRFDSPTRIVFWATLQGAANGEQQMPDFDIHQSIESLCRHQESVKSKAKNVKFGAKSQKQDTQYAMRDRRYEILCLAADQFVTTRAPSTMPRDSRDEPQNTKHEIRATILAGFPWFADWGRDAFIALPGLLLSTGRFDEAKSVLTTFAQAANEGMIPNRFDDNSDTAYFNSVDASLWFIDAAFQYLNTVGDSETFMQRLLPTIRWIVDCYHNGTRFGICADADGLIIAGDRETQLTWMDARYAGRSFTPRYGKAVEVNALWYNGLCQLAQFYADGDIENAKHYKSMADKVAAGFRKLFWNESKGYLNDCILPEGTVDASLRPNQIFAVSLPFSPLSAAQQAAVVDVVEKNLLTPYGLRTLSKMVPPDSGGNSEPKKSSKDQQATGKRVQDSRYKGTYTGGQHQRDEAYHQGTVWPYLMGPFIASFLKVNGFSRKSKKRAAEFIEPLMQHLTEDGCLGQICEIFDGDAPHKPRGCFAQAWSVAELIRAYQLINS